MDLPHLLLTFENTAADQRLKFLMTLCESCPSHAEAQALVPAFLALPVLRPAPLASDHEGGWLRHHWLMSTSRARHTPWTHVLLDHGVDPNLYDPDRQWGGGQLLRELLTETNPNPDPTLEERLWGLTDMHHLMAVTALRLNSPKEQWRRHRYERITDLVAVRHHATPEMEAEVAALVAVAGETRLPRYLALTRQKRDLASPPMNRPQRQRRRG